MKKSNWGLGPIQCNLEADLLAVMGRMQGRPAGYCGPLWSCGQGDIGGGGSGRGGNVVHFGSAAMGARVMVEQAVDMEEMHRFERHF